MTIEKILYQSVLWRGIYFVTAFILNIVLARQLGATDSGVLFFLVNFYTLVLMVLGVGMEAAVGYMAAKKESLQYKLLNFSVLATLVIALASALVFWILPKLNLLDNTMQQPIRYAVFFISGNFLLGASSVLYYAKGNFFVPNLLSSIFNIALIIFLFTGPDFEDVKLIYFSGFAVVAAITAITFYSSYKERDRGAFLSGNTMKELYRYSVHAYLGNLLFFLLYRIDYWFVQTYCSGEDLGNYIQVSRLAQMFFVLPTILASALLPYTASGKREEVKNVLTRLCRALLLVYSVVCIGIIILGKWIFPWLYGESFNNMYEPFILLVPGILALSTLFTLTAYYAGKNKLKVNIYGALLALFIILAGDFLFIPRYGINAAAFISSAGYIAYHIYVLRIFSKEYNVPAAEFFKIKFSDLAWIKDGLLNRHSRSNESQQ